MGKKRSRKKPIPVVAPPMKSLKRARKVTSKFHKITHAINQLQQEQQEQQQEQQQQQQLQALQTELEELGGREVYQQASVVTTARCSSTKWVVKALRRRGVLEPTASSSSSFSSSSSSSRLPRVLEVGAINAELLSTRGLDVRAIDLLARHPKIEERDFFSLAGETARPEGPADTDDSEVESDSDSDERSGGSSSSSSSAFSSSSSSSPRTYDVIVCSMVINCVPTPEDRGRM